MKKIQAALAVAVATSLVACVAQKPVAQINVPFDEAAYLQYTTPGQGSITGQGFLRQRGGGVVTCAGDTVMLLPATVFFRSVVAQARGGAQFTAFSSDPRYKYMVRMGRCDAQGNFSFANLPAGAWLVATRVGWEVANSPQGGTLLREVALSSGGTQHVLLSDADFAGR